jgi:dCTP deaminase
MSNIGILVRDEIIRARQDSGLIIEPFRESHLQPSSYDISVNQVLDSSDAIHDFDELRIEHLQLINLISEERFEAPLDVVGHISFRTTYRKLGLVTDLGRLEAGWKGRLVLEVFNASKTPVLIKRGERIATVEFVRLPISANSPYEGRFQNFGL